jgi:hypothetical protein
MFPVGSDPKLSASGGHVQLAGQDYVMSPLSDEDFGEFENWMRARPIIIAKQNIGAVPNLTEQEKEIILKQAMEISARINMVSTDGLQIMSSLDGAAYMTYLGLRKRHPELTIKQIRVMLMDNRTLEAAMARFEELNNLAGLPGKVKKGGRQKTADRRVKQAADFTVTQLSNDESTPNSAPDLVGAPEK